MSEYRAAIHGHVNPINSGSNKKKLDDGLVGADVIVRAAARNRIDLLGVSSHDTTANIRFFFDSVKRHNASNDRQIIPVAGVELTVQVGPALGHLLLAQIGMQEDSFIQFLNRTINSGQSDLTDTIRRAVSGDYQNVIAVITHPGYDRIPSVPLSQLERLPEEIGSEAMRRVGVEVVNGFTAISGGSPARQEEALRISTSSNFARIGGSDFHTGFQVAQTTTNFIGQPGQDAAAAFLGAFDKRETYVEDRTNRLTMLRLYGVALHLLLNKQYSPIEFLIALSGKRKFDK